MRRGRADRMSARMRAHAELFNEKHQCLLWLRGGFSSFLPPAFLREKPAKNKDNGSFLFFLFILAFAFTTASVGVLRLGTALTVPYTMEEYLNNELI